jgi:outer membrane murein-binding lipoprotein Lpp
MSLCQIFISSLHEVASRFNEKDSDVARVFTALMEGTVKTLEAAELRYEEKVKQVQDENQDLKQKVDSLENKVKNFKDHAITAQLEHVRGNVMVRTDKTAADVSDFIIETIAKSGAPKPSPSSFFIQQMNSDTPKTPKNPPESTQKKDTAKSPKKNKTGKQTKADKAAASAAVAASVSADKTDKTNPQTNLFKVNLGGRLKNLLFKGLAASVSTRAASSPVFTVSHDVPRYLSGHMRMLEKAAFSIRKNHKDVKTKISLKDFNLVLSVKCAKDQDWVSVEKLPQMKSTKVEYRESETNTFTDVWSLIKSLEEF